MTSLLGLIFIVCAAVGGPALAQGNRTQKTAEEAILEEYRSTPIPSSKDLATQKLFRAFTNYIHGRWIYNPTGEEITKDPQEMLESTGTIQTECGFIANTFAELAKKEGLLDPHVLVVLQVLKVVQGPLVNVLPKGERRLFDPNAKSNMRTRLLDFKNFGSHLFAHHYVALINGKYYDPTFNGIYDREDEFVRAKVYPRNNPNDPDDPYPVAYTPSPASALRGSPFKIFPLRNVSFEDPPFVLIEPGDALMREISREEKRPPRMGAPLWGLLLKNRNLK